MTIGGRIAVMRGGVLQQQGSPQTVYDAPDNLFVAAFIGSPPMNLLYGRIEHDGDTLLCVLGDRRLPVAAADGHAAALASYTGTDVAVGMRPEHLGDPAEGSADRPRLRGYVKFVEQLGSETMVQIELDVKPVALDRMLELPGDDGETAGMNSLRGPRSDRALVTARFDAHANVSLGDLIEVAVRTERLQYFDLTTGRAIRQV
jgi:multiple sugar transport system ATP-binding protein